MNRFRWRGVFGLWTVLAAVALLWSCGEKSLELDANELSNMLSITSVSRQPISDSSNPSRVAGVIVDADVVQVGDVFIPVPFLMTWRIREAGGEMLGQATRRFEKEMVPGARQHVTLRITFPPRPNLDGLQDVVTFDPLEE